MIEFINNYVIPGLVLGSIYALGAIGVSMIYSILRFAHFAHGDLMTLGAYIAFAVVVALGWPPVAAMPFALVGTVAASLAIDRFAYRLDARDFLQQGPVAGHRRASFVERALPSL